MALQEVNTILLNRDGLYSASANPYYSSTFEYYSSLSGLVCLTSPLFGVALYF